VEEEEEEEEEGSRRDGVGVVAVVASLRGGEEVVVVVIVVVVVVAVVPVEGFDEATKNDDGMKNSTVKNCMGVTFFSVTRDRLGRGVFLSLDKWFVYTPWEIN
jgi:hypothetical protein